MYSFLAIQYMKTTYMVLLYDEERKKTIT